MLPLQLGLPDLPWLRDILFGVARGERERERALSLSVKYFVRIVKNVI